jgi:hypothetical protein
LAVLLASAAFRPLDPEWLSTLPAPIQAAMGRGLLDRAVLRWESLEPLALWLRSPVVQGLGEPFEGLLEETLLLQGRPEAQNGPGCSLRLEGLRLFLEDHWGSPGRLRGSPEGSRIQGRKGASALPPRHQRLVPRLDPPEPRPERRGGGHGAGPCRAQARHRIHPGLEPDPGPGRLA